MRKVTKILVKLLSAMVMLLIILPLSITLLLTIPSVQNYAATLATDFASKKIDAKVDIGYISFSRLNRFTLHDLMVEDQLGDTLLYSATTNIDISHLSILAGEVVVASVELNDGSLRLREISESLLNIKQIIDRITNPERKSQFRSSLNNIELNNIEFSLERIIKRSPPYGVDFGDITMEITHGVISDFVTQGGTTWLTIDSFEGREVSGLEVDDFGGELTISEGELHFEQMHITTPESHIEVRELNLKGESWQDFTNFISDVSICLSVENSTLSSSDVAYFTPDFVGSSVTLSHLEFDMVGYVDNFKSEIKSLSFGQSSSLRGNATIVGGENLPTASFNIELSELRSNITDINIVAQQMGLTPLDVATTKSIAAMGEMVLSAKGHGSMQLLEVESMRLRSNIGEVTYRGSVNDIAQNIGCKGSLQGNNFEVGKLLNYAALGAVDLTSEVEYTSSDAGCISAALSGQINSLRYNSYTYSSLDIDLDYLNDELECTINSNDKNFNFDLASIIHFDAQESRYNLIMRVNSADLAALNLNRRDTISNISGSLRVNIAGNDVDNLNGAISLMNINYDYNDSSIYLPLIDIKAQNSDQSKFISLESDFADVIYKSSSSYKDLYSYLKDELRTYIPVLYNENSERKEQRQISFANNYSSLQVSVKEISPLCDAIFKDFNVADNSSLNVMVNPHSNRFMMRAAADFIELKEFAATSLNINANNNTDSLSLYATAADLLYGNAMLPSFTLAAGARNSVLGLSAGFRDTINNNGATLGMRMLFESEQRARITILPSNVSIGDQRWIVSAKDIKAKGASLEVDNFAITNGGQHLTLDGRVSKDMSDTLTLRLKDYNINMITSVISDLGYQIDGLSSGEVTISSLLTSPRILADVSLEDVDVNSIPSPPLRLQALWNGEENRAGIFVTNRQTRDTVVTGYYAPSDMRYFAKLKVDSLNVGLIEPLLATTISNTNGYANVDVSLYGQGKETSLHGDIAIYDMSTMIQFTQVEYFIPTANITIEDNELSSMAQEVFDRDGNRGLLTLRLSLDHLSNVSYRLRMVPENMMVLNTTLQDNELFYGRLYATGVATIDGDKRGVDMDITATSQPNSQFYMPLSSKSTVAKTDFITFVKRDEKYDEEQSKINYRRRFIEERESERRINQTTRINISMALHATPDLDFQLVIDPVVGDIIRAKGEGRMNLAIAPLTNSFEMYGDYNITEGNYLFSLLNPISKRFEIESGSSIQWTGDPIDPQLNIDAVYKVKTSLDPLISSVSSDGSSSRAVPVDCIIHLGDRLSQPSVDFSIEVPTADTEQQAVIANTLIDQETISQQFFYLMLANSFIPISSSYGGSALTASTTASTGFELLTNQLSNWLSSDTYNLSLRYRPESEWSSDEVDMGLSRGLIDNRLLIEVEGNYLADTSQSNNLSNFMGEAYITWLIDKAGALRLKGFTQVIDRYDENQGLQETGIGVYYSESFDNIKDLRRKVKERFTHKKEEEEEESENEN